MDASTWVLAMWTKARRPGGVPRETARSEGPPDEPKRRRSPRRGRRWVSFGFPWPRGRSDGFGARAAWERLRFGFREFVVSTRSGGIPPMTTGPPTGGVPGCAVVLSRFFMRRIPENDPRTPSHPVTVRPSSVPLGTLCASGTCRWDGYPSRSPIAVRGRSEGVRSRNGTYGTGFRGVDQKEVTGTGRRGQPSLRLRSLGAAYRPGTCCASCSSESRRTPA